MTEDQLEQQCLAWFAEGGWEIGHGPDLAPGVPALERVDYRQVLLLADLEAAIQRINPHLPKSAVEQAASVVRKPESLDVAICSMRSQPESLAEMLIPSLPV